MIEEIKKTREYLDYLEEHYNNVQKAWELIKTKCDKKGFRFIYDDWCFFSIDSEVKQHDYSKLSQEEFVQYRQYFFPTEEEKREAEHMGISTKTMFERDFNKAWEHHKEKNSHHWENWTKEKSDSMYADIYLVLMVIDWIAMSFKFGDTAKDYYEKNEETIKLPDWAITHMYEIFDCIY